MTRESPPESGLSRFRAFARRHLLFLPITVLALAGTPPPLDAQTRPEDWNGPRALGLMEQARARRALPKADSLLKNYRAKAEGMVYFYLDRRETDERTLVKTDQIALEVYWAQPDRTKQRIVGMRGENTLPNRMYYHLDHLTVVQNGFGDIIRLGDGDEVRDVPHPAAAGADTIYDFRLSDSLTVRLPGRTEPIRAYAIDVRPKRTDRSALVGSVYVDRESGDIVRMTFTFTPASYVDPRLDYINISLDNSLWDGRYWLPYEQSVQIRRQVPELDFIAGAVIQGRFKVSGYEFNVDLPETLFYGPRVVAVPEAQRKSYAFDRELFADIEDLGLGPTRDMTSLRAQAAALVRQRTLSGLPPLRFNVPNPSAVFRYNRAEGIWLGGGLSYVPETKLRFEGTGGYAFGAGHGAGSLGVRIDGENTRLELRGYVNEPRDLGVRPGVPGALNTVTAATFGDDYMDPHYAAGVRVQLRRRLTPAWSLGMAGRLEHDDSAELVRDGALFDGPPAYRAVRPVDHGTLASGTLSLDRPMRDAGLSAWSGQLAVEIGCFEGECYARPTLEAAFVRHAADRDGDLTLRAAAGTVAGTAPAQRMFLLGGRNTLPGYAYRSFAGDAFAIADAEYGRDLYRPWLRGRLIAAAGWVGASRDATTPGGGHTFPDAFLDWQAGSTDGLRASAGAGVGLFWDMLRMDVARGLRGGEWQLMLSVKQTLWNVL